MSERARERKRERERARERERERERGSGAAGRGWCMGSACKRRVVCAGGLVNGGCFRTQEASAARKVPAQPPPPSLALLAAPGSQVALEARHLMLQQRHAARRERVRRGVRRERARARGEGGESAPRAGAARCSSSPTHRSLNSTVVLACGQRWGAEGACAAPGEAEGGPMRGKSGAPTAPPPRNGQSLCAAPPRCAPARRHCATSPAWWPRSRRLPLPGPQKRPAACATGRRTAWSLPRRRRAARRRARQPLQRQAPQQH